MKQQQQGGGGGGGGGVGGVTATSMMQESIDVLRNNLADLALKDIQQFVSTICTIFFLQHFKLFFVHLSLDKVNTSFNKLLDSKQIFLNLVFL